MMSFGTALLDNLLAAYFSMVDNNGWVALESACMDTAMKLRVTGSIE